MAYPTWPEELPQWLRVEGYSNEFGDARLATSMEIGPPKLRRRTSLATRSVTGRLIVGRNGLARLRRFWEEEIGQGLSPFWFPDQDFMASQLADAAGRGLEDAAARDVQASAWWLVLFAPGAAPAWSARNRVLRQVDINLTILP